MEKKALKKLIQSLQNRVIMAVSFAVLESKPEDVSGEQHASRIQQSVYDNWVKDNDVSLFENKIIELQHEKLFKEINDLLDPKNNTHLAIETLDDSFPGVCSEEYMCDELNETDSDSEENILFKNNVSFIQAMVQLKFTVHSSNSITMNIIHHFQDKFNKYETSMYSTENMVSISIYGDEPRARTVADLNFDQIRLIMNSSKTEHLMKKCLSLVIHFAYKNVFNNAAEMFNLWHGSLMEYLCSVLQDISFHPVCADCILKFIYKSLDDIWSSEGSNKHILWECQLHILSEFCVNSHVCGSVIDFIMVKFNIMINLINKIEFGSCEHLDSIHLIEKLPHFTRFLCMVIKKFIIYETVDMHQTNKKVKYNNYDKVTDLWKSIWRVKSENDVFHIKKNVHDLLKRWKNVCEKLIILSATDFPLISVYIWDIMATLQGSNTQI